MTVLKSLLGRTAEPADDDVDHEPRTDKELRDAFADAIERSDVATVIGVWAGDLVGLAREDNRAFTERLRTVAGLAEDIDAERPRPVDTIDAEAAAIRDAIGTFRDRQERLDAEREAATRELEYEPFDFPSAWYNHPQADELKDAVVTLREYLTEVSEASTEDLWNVYCREAPHERCTRPTFEVEVLPTLAGADGGVEARLWRLGPDADRSEQSIEEYAEECFPDRSTRPVNQDRPATRRALLKAAVRSLADAPPWGRTRLELVADARQRSNQQIPPSFMGPVDEFDLSDRDEYDGLAALLDLPGVEPPADPEWRWVGGEADD